MGDPRPLFGLFSVFPNKHQCNFYNKLMWIFLSSKWCWDLNPQPSERESHPITTRPGLHYSKTLFMTLLLVTLNVGAKITLKSLKPQSNSLVIRALKILRRPLLTNGRMALVLKLISLKFASTFRIKLWEKNQRNKL